MSDLHVIFAGQSNMSGFGNYGPAPYTPTARVQIWVPTANNGHGAWNYMLPGVNTGTASYPNTWASEVQFANDFLRAHPSDGSVLWIVKVAKGSTGLAQDPAEVDWSPHSAGEIFDTASAEIGAARHNLDGTPYAFAHWDILNWMQGETDAEVQWKADAYATNVREFIADARQAWGVEDVSVGRIGDAEPFSQTVRNAEWNLDNGDAPVADVHTIKTIGLGFQPDGIHLDAAGQVSLGDAFFNSWIF